MTDELKRAALAVEKWWVEEGKNSFDGAPACMFALRSALSLAAKSAHANAEGQRSPAGAVYKDAALTDDDILRIWYVHIAARALPNYIEFARAILAAKEKKS